MAGGAIGIAATVYLKVGGVTGAVMFAFGLIVVVMMKLPLFTGQAQHVWSRRGTDLSLLGLMLLMNLGGCFCRRLRSLLKSGKPLRISF